MSNNKVIKPVEEHADYPGSRVLRMSFKDAVEHFIKIKYGDRVGRDLTLDEISQDFPLLRAAISGYKTKLGIEPFGLRYLGCPHPKRIERLQKRRGQLSLSQLDESALVAMRAFEQSKVAPSRPSAIRHDAPVIAGMLKRSDCI